MLFASNVFMTFAWYGHLKFKESSLPLVIMVSWGIAFFEYWLAVPANRWGSAVYSAAQLKTMQEVITLVVFAGFSVLYLKEPLGWNHALGFGFIALERFSFFTNGREISYSAGDRAIVIDQAFAGIVDDVGDAPVVAGADDVNEQSCAARRDARSRRGSWPVPDPGRRNRVRPCRP